MDRERWYGGAFMATFALVALYMIYDGVIALVGLWHSVRMGAPAVVAVSADAGVVPGGVVVLIFAVLEIGRPGVRVRRVLVALALGAVVLTLVAPIGLQLGIGPVLAGRGYQRCAGRVVGYTLPAVRYARDRRSCPGGHI